MSVAEVSSDTILFVYMVPGIMYEYVLQGDDNQLHLTVDVEAESISREQFKAHLEANAESFEIPAIIVINGNIG